MHKLALAGALLLCCLPALAVDRGQFENVAPEIRTWFKAQKNPVSGIPCCDVADGRRTTWQHGDGPSGYEVPIDGVWMPVPLEALIENAGNPTGEAVVWYTQYNGKPHIRCFIPAGGV